MRDQDTEALRNVVEAMIRVNGGTTYSVVQLAAMVSKASKFLFPMSRYRSDDGKEAMAREAEVFLSLAEDRVNHDFAKPKLKPSIGIKTAY